MKLKVAIVCHFSSGIIREHLHLKRWTLENFLRKLLHKPIIRYYDFAPWVDSIVSQFPSCQDIDLSVIAPHLGMINNLEEFCFDGVNYFFFKSKPSRILMLFDRLFFKQKLLKFRHNKKTVISIINVIKPDLVVLIGTENPYYSSTLINLRDYPVLVLCQTIINCPEFELLMPSTTFKKCSSVEKELLLGTDYVGVYCEKHRALLRDLGYSGYIFDFQWPNKNKPIKKDCENDKQYDFINFASRMSLEKGYHDSVYALAIVKKKFPHVTLVLVDSGNEQVRKEIEAIIRKEGLENNVLFVPFFQKREDLFRYLSKVRFAVLPCKIDNISGTQLQAMNNGLPLVVYQTEGTITFNQEKECALIAKHSDIADLAEQMCKLMADPEIGDKLMHNAFEFMDRYHEKRSNSFGRLLLDFQVVVEHYYFGKQIPSELTLP